MASTYLGKPYYPAWLDNLADDVTGEGPAWDGAREPTSGCVSQAMRTKSATCPCAPIRWGFSG